MPCLLALAALVTPRLVILALWFLSDWFAGMFPSIIWPIIGFVVAPTTLLWYSAVQNWYGGVWSLWPVIVLVIAVMIDFSPATSKR